MLKKLIIKNVALISNMEIDFDSKLNILSGETGAGKSIIVDSLFLILGAKYDKMLLSYGKESGLVEGIFEPNTATKNTLNEFLIEYDEEIIVTRKFNKDGKNDIRINGRSVTISMLKDITSTLVDIYGQNQHLTILEKEQQLRTIEFFEKEKTSVIISNVCMLYNEYRNLKKELDSLGDESSRQREIEVLKSQIEEIKLADIKDNEENELMQRRKVLLASEKIKAVMGNVALILCENENSVSVALQSAKSQLLQIKDADEYNDLLNRIDSVKLEVDDIGYTASSILDEVDNDEKNIEIIEKRLELVRRIVRKYGDKEACEQYLKSSQDRLDLLSDADNLHQKINVRLGRCKQTLYDASVELSVLRKKGAMQFCQSIINELEELGMHAAKFEVRFEDIPAFEECDNRFSANGFDSVEYYLSTNKGQPIKPLSKIISGGEMSRFMLAIKVIMSNIEQIDTLIFDEIDTGISGIIGHAVGKKLAKISRNKQVLCVSHLAQIVAMADKNYLISKEDKDNKTSTSVKLIDNNHKIKEIARLSGGLSSKTAYNAADELVNWCNGYKKSL